MRQLAEGFYIVRAGESLSSIARKELGSAQRFSEIAALNPHIRNPNLIYEGDFLFLPLQGQNICFEPMLVTSDAVADLKEASDDFKHMSHSQRETLMYHGEAVSLLGGVMAEIDGHEAFEPVLVAAHTVKEVAEQVQRNIRDVGNIFLHDMKMLKGVYPQVKVTDELLKQEVLAIQNRADATLQRLIGQTFRSKLSMKDFGTQKLMDYVMGAGRRPTRFKLAINNTGKWIKRLEGGAAVIAGLDFLMAGAECIHDVEDGTQDLRRCAKRLGGFVGGTSTAVLGGLIIAGLGLGGAPLIGAGILLAGLTIGGSHAVSSFSAGIYSWVND